MKLFFLTWLVIFSCGFWWSQPHKHEGPHVAPMPDPYHIEWTQFPVGGFHLLSPVVDSTGAHLQFILPEGALLLIPHEVEGSDPDTLRTKS
jgi:hypothetical protein